MFVLCVGMVSCTRNLSFVESANCYIVTKGGTYKFKTVKGNSSASVGVVAEANVLWESFGAENTPNKGDLIRSVTHKGEYVIFETADTYREGNAVIAVKDAEGNILWSWHIWMTDQPQGQVYFNNAGTMMDRNLGATSASPGAIYAYGLLYQWGRKDPFPGGLPKDYCGSWGMEVETIGDTFSFVKSDIVTGTIAYATAHPMTYIGSRDFRSLDWYYTGTRNTMDNRWTTSGEKKSVYDPCPAGWRVPDGGENGVWSKALGSMGSFAQSSLYDSANAAGTSSSFSSLGLWNDTNKGVNFSGKFGGDETIWYPASGYRDGSYGSLRSVGSDGSYWSASPSSDGAYSLDFSYGGYVSPSSSNDRAYGLSVRCIKE